MPKFKVIYIDPPWEFRVYSKATGSGRSAESHYKTQATDWLTDLRVGALADDDCVMLMWVTWPTLMDAFKLATAWGFEYKTCGFLWSKLTKRWYSRLPKLIFGGAEAFQRLFFFGMGYWTRANTEPCLLFTKGSPKRLSRKVRQFIASPIREHSRKPDEIYGRIEEMFEGPYLEVFARQAQPGWIAIGDGVDGRDITASIAQLELNIAEVDDERAA
jgi:N6-adenosine-specific RNA methylase IME4